MFGRAAITLGICPHSSLICVMDFTVYESNNNLRSAHVSLVFGSVIGL